MLVCFTLYIPAFSTENIQHLDIESNNHVSSSPASSWSKKKLIVGISSLACLAGSGVGIYYLVDYINDSSNPESFSPSMSPSELPTQYPTFPPHVDEHDLLSLPQYDKNRTFREEQLMSIQGKIENSQRFHAYDGKSYKEIPRGPLPLPGSLAEKIIASEAVDFNSRGAEIPDSLVYGALSSGAIPLVTIEDFAEMYQYFEPQLPVPLALKNWKNDTYYGDLRRTYLGHKLTKLESPLFDLDLNQTQLEDLLGHSNGLENSELYGIDHWDVQNYNANDHRVNHVPGVQAMFTVKDDQLIPIAIRLSNNLVYTRFDTSDEWMLAKISLNIAETLWTSANHFMTTHLLIEPIRVEMMRHLSERHPVYALLSHHMKNGFVTTIAGLIRLFTNGTTLDEISAWGAEGYMNYYDQLTKEGVDFNNTFENDMKNRGLNNLVAYRQGSDSKKILNKITVFVYEFLLSYYGANADDEVMADKEIQAWAAACASTATNGGNVKNFPTSIESIDVLTHVVSHIIYLAAVKHHAMNSNTLWHGSPFPAASFSLWAPLPDKKGEPLDLVSYLPPSPELVAKNVLLLHAFLRKLNSEDSLTYSYVEINLGEKSETLIREFQKNMIEIQREIRERERQEQGLRFEILSPENLPYFTWI